VGEGGREGGGGAAWRGQCGINLDFLSFWSAGARTCILPLTLSLGHPGYAWLFRWTSPDRNSPAPPAWVALKGHSGQKAGTFFLDSTWMMAWSSPQAQALHLGIPLLSCSAVAFATDSLLLCSA
jgi:hypothetical protein